MNLEDDEGPDPDYGVFGGTGPLPRLFSPEERLRIAVERRRREREARTSREFNRHMIDLFNGRIR